MANGAASNIIQEDALSPSRLGSISITELLAFCICNLIAGRAICLSGRGLDRPTALRVFTAGIDFATRPKMAFVRSFDGVIPGGGCIYV